MQQNQTGREAGKYPRLSSFAGVALLALAGCASAPEVVYSVVSVSQEGGIRFSPVTDENDGVFAPRINRAEARISKISDKIFDISRDGNKVAYLATRDKKTNIYVKNVGVGSRATTQRTFRDSVSDVAISPDGKLVAFTDRREGNLNIYLTSAEAGSAIRQVTSSPLSEYHPAFSPDGRSLMYIQLERESLDAAAKTKTPATQFMWLYDLSRGTQTQYAEGSSSDFAPDSKKVVFTRNNRETGNTELWMLELDAGQEILIASDKNRGFLDPAVSPDGSRIAFVSGSTDRDREKGTPGNFDIFLINIDGSGLTQLTFHPGDDILPRWAPDGRAIYFLSQRGSRERVWNIWKMDLRVDHFLTPGSERPAEIEVRPLR